MRWTRECNDTTLSILILKTHCTFMTKFQHPRCLFLSHVPHIHSKSQSQHIYTTLVHKQTVLYISSGNCRVTFALVRCVSSPLSMFLTLSLSSVDAMLFAGITRCQYKTHKTYGKSKALVSTWALNEYRLKPIWRQTCSHPTNPDFR